MSKRVLVCLGVRKRLVEFHGDLHALTEQIYETFSDVLGADSEIVVQVRHIGGCRPGLNLFF